MDFYLRGDPHFIPLIDNKVAVLLRGGYAPLKKRCSMGRREMAFTPDRRIYPCERLIDDHNGDGRHIGTLDQGLDLSRLSCRQAAAPQSTPNAWCAVFATTA